MNLRENTYDGLKHRIQTFISSADEPLLILCSNGGYGKSRIVGELLPEARWINGKCTAFTLFEFLMEDEGTNTPIVFDDNDDLHRDQEMVKLLKQVCQTEPVRTVAWGSRGELRFVKTSAPVVIITNDWKRLTKHVGALMDRGCNCTFEPSNEELHAYAATWFDDLEVLGYIGCHLEEASGLSLRQYRQSRTWRKGGHDWQADLQREWGTNDPRKVVIRLLKDGNFKDGEARILEFTRITGMTRMTYFRIKKELGESRSYGT